MRLFVFPIAFGNIIKYFINDDSQWYALIAVSTVHQENGIHALTSFTFVMLSRLNMSVEIEYSMSEQTKSSKRISGAGRKRNVWKRFPVGVQMYVCNCVHLVKSLKCEWNCKRREIAREMLWIQLKVFSRLTVKCKHKKIISESLNYCAVHAKVLPYHEVMHLLCMHVLVQCRRKHPEKNIHFILLHRIAFAWWTQKNKTIIILLLPILMHKSN